MGDEVGLRRRLWVAIAGAWAYALAAALLESLRFCPPITGVGDLVALGLLTGLVFVALGLLACVALVIGSLVRLPAGLGRYLGLAAAAAVAAALGEAFLGSGRQRVLPLCAGVGVAVICLGVAGGLRRRRAPLRWWWAVPLGIVAGVAGVLSPVGALSAGLLDSEGAWLGGVTAAAVGLGLLVAAAALGVLVAGLARAVEPQVESGVRQRLQVLVAFVCCGLTWSVWRMSPLTDEESLFLGGVVEVGLVVAALYGAAGARGFRMWRHPAVALAVFSLGLLPMWVGGMRQTYQRLAVAEISHLRRDVQALEAIASNVDRFHEEMQKGEADAAADRRLLPPVLDIAGFEAVVRGSAGVSAVETGAVRRVTLAESPDGRAIEIVVRLQGGPAAVAALRRRVRDSGRLVRWVGITPAGGGDHEVRLEVFALPEEPPQRYSVWRSARRRAIAFWVPRTARELEALVAREAKLVPYADQVYAMGQVREDRRRRAGAVAALRESGDTT